MVLIICLILFIWGIYGLASDYDHGAERRNDYRTAERRHREKLLESGGNRHLESGRINQF